MGFYRLRILSGQYSDMVQAVSLVQVLTTWGSSQSSLSRLRRSIVVANAISRTCGISLGIWLGKKISVVCL